MKITKIFSFAFYFLFLIPSHAIKDTILIRHEERDPDIDTSNPTRYIYPDVIFGHVHIAKTGGSSIAGIFSNKYERICSNKGNSQDAYRFNELMKERHLGGRERFGAMKYILRELGFEDCDYISLEHNSNDWISLFPDGKFHNVTVQLHVPCRDPLDHLMSQCNYHKNILKCDASSDDEFYESIRNCMMMAEGSRMSNRYSHKLKVFDLKCFDFKKQFTAYSKHMSSFLQKRRFESGPFIKRETNLPRNKENECLWKRPDLMKKAQRYLLENYEYYQFCKDCLGSKNDIVK